MTETRKSIRKQNLHSFKRQKILDAAAVLFRSRGMEGTTMRAIAADAGYSTGAPYVYFQSKEDIYAELLGASLTHLGKFVKAATMTATSPQEQARAAFEAYFTYYLQHAEDLQLGLYLFSSGEVKGRGFSEETNRQLNGKMMTVLGHMANSLHRIDGVTPRQAQQETLDAVSHISGILLLELTGRLSIFGSNAQEMIDRYMGQMLKRLRT